jgi:hypothetical protein
MQQLPALMLALCLPISAFPDREFPTALLLIRGVGEGFGIAWHCIFMHGRGSNCSKAKATLTLVSGLQTVFRYFRQFLAILELFLRLL